MAKKKAGKKKTKVVFFRRKKPKRKKFEDKKLALEVAKDITNSDNVVVKKRRIPKPMIRYIENNVRVKYKKRPVFYTYEPKKGHFFRPKKECGGWDGASVTAYDTRNANVQGTVVVLPKSHMKDKDVKENVLLHELTETLVGQHMLKPGKSRSPTAVANFEHGVFAMNYEKKDLNKRKLNRRQISGRAKKLFNDPESWK